MGGVSVAVYELLLTCHAPPIRVAYLRWTTRRLHLLNSLHGTRRNGRAKIGIAYTTLLLVIMTGYKINVTGNDNNSNNLVKRAQHMQTN